MQLDQIISDAADQERGAVLELADPVSGEPTGIKLKIAGPDSLTQRKAALQLADELSEMAGPDGRVTAEQREAARVACLARCVLSWEIEEDGKPVPFSHGNVIRLLKAARWVQEQADSFAADRSNFRAVA